MSALKVLLFILATFLILLGLTFLSKEEKNAFSSNIDIGIIKINYPTAKKFLSYQSPKKANLSTLKKTLDELGSEEELDSLLAQIKYDTTYNFSDSSLKGLQVIKTEDFGKVQDGILMIEFPNDDRSLYFPIWKKLESVLKDKKSIRAIHYGDSQIEGDRMTAYIRDKLQKLFGGNGPGFIPLKTVYHQNSVEITCTENWTRHAVFDRRSEKIIDNRYGAFMSASRFSPMLPDSLITDSSEVYNASISIGKDKRAYSNAKAFNVIKIHYGNCTQPTSIEVFNNDEQIVYDSLRTDSNYHHYDIVLAETPTNLKVDFKGKSSPDFYGVTLDGNYGFNIDNVAMRGSSGSAISKVNFNEYNLMMDQLNVEFVILQFGGNVMPYLKDKEHAERSAHRFKYRIRLMRRLRPSAQILVIGPSDMSTKIDGLYQTYPLLEYYIDKIKEAAKSENAAYWDIYRAMGGENSMVAWVEEHGWAATDYTHFSRTGTKKISRLLFEALLLEYQYYQSETQQVP